MVRRESPSAAGGVWAVNLRLLAALAPIAMLVTCAGIAYADEKADLLETVHAYFRSEKQGDVQKVWELLAPSSEFKKAYSYPFFEEMVRKNPAMLKDYKIDGVLEIRDNDDTVSLPNVQKIALVQVTVRLAGHDAKDLIQVRVFTFLKEAERWFKG